MNPNDPSKKTLQLLYVINQLQAKAFDADSQEALKFIILNDTIHLVRYNRALLWNFEFGSPYLLGVSGQVDIHARSDFTEKWQKLMELIPNREEAKILTAADFASEKGIWEELQQGSNTTILWLPLKADGKMLLGLWVELWYFKEGNPPDQKESIELLSRFLAPTYGIAWDKMRASVSPGRFLKRYSHPLSLILLSFLISTFIVRVPLRVVAPCEVVPKDPYYVTAPLDGIIDEMDVKPGHSVKIGDLLFTYDKRVIEKNLEVAKKKVEIAEAEWNRALNLGQRDKDSLTQVSILKLKLDKEQFERALAQYEYDQSSVKAKIDGVVLLDDPDSWRGRPVKMGERVLIVTNSKETKVKIWIPESDNVWLNVEIPIKVILNTRPEESLKAKLIYVSNESSVDDKNIASFVAEASWVTPPEDVKLGVRGTAILYGDNVSLFYYALRKPWALLRYFFGV